MDQVFCGRDFVQVVGLVWLKEVEIHDIRGTERGILFSKIPDLWEKLSSCWLNKIPDLWEKISSCWLLQL